MQGGFDGIGQGVNSPTFVRSPSRTESRQLTRQATTPGEKKKQIESLMKFGMGYQDGFFEDDN